MFEQLARNAIPSDKFEQIFGENSDENDYAYGLYLYCKEAQKKIMKKEPVNLHDVNSIQIILDYLRANAPAGIITEVERRTLLTKM